MQTNSHEEVFDPFSIRRDPFQELRALSWMISATMHQGDSLEMIASGVGRLLDRQCEALAEIEDAIREEYRRFDATVKAEASPTPKRMREDFIAEKVREGVGRWQRIAQALNLKKVTVERVIGKLIGEADRDYQERGSAVNE